MNVTAGNTFVQLVRILYMFEYICVFLGVPNARGLSSSLLFAYSFISD